MNKNNLTRLEKLHRLKYKIEKEIRLLEEKAIDGNQVVSYAARWFRVPFLELIELLWLMSCESEATHLMPLAIL